MLTIVAAIGVMLSFSLEMELEAQRATTACSARGHAASMAQTHPPVTSVELLDTDWKHRPASHRYAELAARIT